MSQPARTAAAEDADLSGRTLGDFRLLRRLGRGAMAEVYLAEQASLRRQVAMKVLKRGLAGDANYVQRFQNEAQAAAALVHANIVQIYEVGCDDGIHYIAQEYVQGMNLREWMQRNGVPDAKLAVAVLRQAAAALFKAAQAGITHRDVKPENIMLSKSGEVKVADFGLARIAREDDALHLTQVGITMGTPLYMSPEQVEGKNLDGRSDLYSLGVTCYHLLTGAPPFQGETALAVAVQHLKSQPKRLEEARPDLPPGLCRIVHRLMEKKPAERYASARELLRDLRSLPISDDADGDDAAWAGTLDDQAVLELSVTAGLKSAVGRLDQVMKTQAVALAKQDRLLRKLAIACAVAFVFGAVAAAVKARRTPSILARPDSEQTTTIPRQASARDQFLAAQMQLTDSEAWLKSVAQYFPDDAFFTARAKQELARLYWKENRLDEAAALYQEFADRLEDEYKAFGLAGRSLVETKRDELDKAAQTLALVMPLRTKLDPRMQADLQYAIAANQQALRDKGVLTSEMPQAKVPKQATAQEQLYFAQMQLGDQEKEDSLQSVQLYFPQDVYYTTAAKRELALLYLEQPSRGKSALAIFAEFAAHDDADREARAFGLAGEAIIWSRDGDGRRAASALEQLQPLMDAIDPAIAGRLADALPNVLADLPARAAQVWRTWRERVPDDQPPPAGGNPPRPNGPPPPKNRPAK